MVGLAGSLFLLRIISTIIIVIVIDIGIDTVIVIVMFDPYHRRYHYGSFVIDTLCHVSDCSQADSRAAARGCRPA